MIEVIVVQNSQRVRGTRFEIHFPFQYRDAVHTFVTDIHKRNEIGIPWYLYYDF